MALIIRHVFYELRRRTKSILIYYQLIRLMFPDSFIQYSMFLFHNQQNKQKDSLDYVHVEVGMRHDKHLESIL